MTAIRHRLAKGFDQTETFFDQLKLSYKWRFNRFSNPAVVTYRGFGTSDRIWLRGRVLDDRRAKSTSHDSVWRNVTTMLRRIETDEIPGATVRIRLYDATVEMETDDNGFFDAILQPSYVNPETTWHEAQVELLRPLSRSREPVEAVGKVLVPAEHVEYGVISDLDDTVIRTGAQNRLQMGRVVLLNNAATRTPFPGVAAFYRSLQLGPDQQGSNPIFYVSSSPWNLYELFDDFMEAHEVPAGPVLLRDVGFATDHFFFGSHQSHKMEQVDRILAAFPDLPFILIGDSGQHDPEIYRDVVRDHPGRIRAIFIRDVTPPERDAEVHRIVSALSKQGIPMALSRNTEEAARKAAELGLVAPEVLHELAADVRKQPPRKRLAPRLLERLIGYLPSFIAT